MRFAEPEWFAQRKDEARERALGFTWERNAAQVLEAYGRAAEQGR